MADAQRSTSRGRSYSGMFPFLIITAHLFSIAESQPQEGLSELVSSSKHIPQPGVSDGAIPHSHSRASHQVRVAVSLSANGDVAPLHAGTTLPDTTQDVIAEYSKVQNPQVIRQQMHEQVHAAGDQSSKPATWRSASLPGLQWVVLKPRTSNDGRMQQVEELPPTAKVPSAVLIFFALAFSALFILSIVQTVQMMQPLGDRKHFSANPTKTRAMSSLFARRAAGNLLSENAATDSGDVQVKDEQHKFFSKLELFCLTLPRFALAFTICLGISVVPEEVAHMAPENKGLVFGIFLGIFSAAQLLSPVFGNLSDRLRTKHGRRRPILICCSFVAGASFMTMWLASASLSPVLYGVGLLGLALTWAMIIPVYQGLIVDVVHEEQIIEVSTFSAFNLTAGPLVSFITAYIAGDDYYWLYVISIVSALVGVMLAVSVTEESQDLPPPASEDWASWVKTCYWMDVERFPNFFILILTQIFITGVTIGKSMEVFWVRDTYNVTTDGALIEKVASIALVVYISATCSAVLSQWIPLPPRKLAQIPALVTSFTWLMCLVFSMFSNAYDYLEIYGFFFGFANGMYLFADQALTLIHLPDKENASRYTALYNVAFFVGGVLYSAVDSLLLQLFGKMTHPFLPGPRAGPVPEDGYRFEGFAMMFLFNSVMCLLWCRLYSKIKDAQEPTLTSLDAERAKEKKYYEWLQSVQKPTLSSESYPCSSNDVPKEAR